MSGGESEHDEPLKDKGRTSSTGSSKGMGEWVCSCAGTEGMRKLRIEDIDFSFKEKCFLLGDVCQLTASTSGVNTALRTMGEGQLEDHCCAHLWAPEGVVNPGVMVTMNYAVILEGPFSFPKGYRRVSSVLFLQCDNPKQLQKELTIRLHHWAGKESGLCFMKADHELGSGKSHYNFRRVEGGDFDLDSKSGTIRLKEHFCLLCAAIDDSKKYVSDRYYAVLCCKRDQEFRICITYAIPSWIKAIKKYYWTDNGGVSNTECRDFTWQSKDAALRLEAPTLATSGKGWQCVVTQEAVHFKKLDVDKNLKRSSKCCREEMNQGIYPPSLKFTITYGNGKNETHMRMAHKVSVTGCDKGDEVAFKIDVFEPPTSPSDIPHFPVMASAPVQEESHGAESQRLSTAGGKKMTQRGAELEPLPLPQPISNGQSDHRGVQTLQGHEDSTTTAADSGKIRKNFDGPQTPEQHETMSTPVAESTGSAGSNKDPMKEWNRKALICLTAQLKQNVRLNNGLNDKLQAVAEGFMSEAEAKAVMSKQTNAERMGELIEILLGKSEADFAIFCKMLRDVRYGVWAYQLEKKAGEFKRNPATGM